MNPGMAIELAPFSVAAEVTTRDLLEASDALERDFLSKARGYIGRVLVQKDTASWADIVVWASAEHAEKAMAAAATSSACRAYFQCMKQEEHDEPANGVTLFRSLKAYGRMKLQEAGISASDSEPLAGLPR